MTQYTFFSVLLFVSLLILCQGTSAASSTDKVADGLSLLQESLDNQEECEQRIRAFDKIHTVISGVFYKKAKSLEEAGNTTESQIALQEAEYHINIVKAAYDLGLLHFDDSAKLHNFYGEIIHDFFNQSNEAAKHWKRASQLDPDFARAFCNFGMYACHTGMYSIGLDNMDTALRLEPDDVDLLYNMTQLYLLHPAHIMQIRQWPRNKVYNEAMKMSKKAVYLRPGDFEVLRDYALNFFTGEDFEIKVNWNDAVKAWQAARSKAKTDAELFNTWLNEARAHKRNDNKEKTMECLDAAQSIWPESSVVKQLIKDFRG
ncbi:MAG: hypothetical protein KAH38_09295 [Candidatus Hydrogenedentes bacterium]|nr:hypothetical protein [Candidatus Hydrogenedentota bacterium]